MKVSDMGGSLVLMAVGGFMARQAEKLSLGTPGSPGPGFFPFYLSLLLIGMALMTFFQGMKQKPKEAETGLRHGRVILTLAGILVYAFILEPVGYLISTFFLTLLLIQIMVERARWFVPVLACFISLSSYVLFRIWLQVLLPRGMMGF